MFIPLIISPSYNLKEIIPNFPETYVYHNSPKETYLAGHRKIKHPCRESIVLYATFLIPLLTFQITADKTSRRTVQRNIHSQEIVWKINLFHKLISSSISFPEQVFRI